MKWIDKLTKENPCPEAWQDKGENGYPRSELGYFRCDYDGYRWWNTVWPVNGRLAAPELVKEFDAVYDAFLKAFPTREAMRRYCMERAETTSDATEFNAYLTMEHGFYWLRMITRKGDYNLYLHCISKAAISKNRIRPLLHCSRILPSIARNSKRYPKNNVHDLLPEDLVELLETHRSETGGRPSLAAGRSGGAP